MTRKFNPRSPKRSLSQQDATDHSSIPPSGSSSSGLHHHSPYRASPSRRPLGPHHHSNTNATPASAYIYRAPQFSTVHQRNLHIASRPLVFVFDAFGVAIFQLFSVLRAFLLLFWRPISSYWRNRKEKCRGQPVVVTTADYPYATTFHSSPHSPNSLLFDTLSASSESEVTIMNANRSGRHLTHATSMRGGPGLTDPLLAQQKKHHRKAYEYISKALRIDEDHSGKASTVMVYACLIVLLSHKILKQSYNNFQQIQKK